MWKELYSLMLLKLVVHHLTVVYNNLPHLGIGFAVKARGEEMNRVSHNVGMGLYALMKKNCITVDELAQRIGFSLRDTYRIIEGKLFLSPLDIDAISRVFNTTPEYFIKFIPDKSCLLPNLEYNKEFSSDDNLFLIVDMIDDYIELKEQM